MEKLAHKDDPSATVQSPCVRNCCLNNHDICVGCGRHLTEITGWHGMTNQEKAQTLIICAQRLNIMKRY